MARCTHILAATMLLVLALAPGLFAQSQATTGVIKGMIMDESEAALPGVLVTLRNTATNFERSLVTDNNGRFRATLMPLGPYALTATIEGFATLVRDGLTLVLGQSIDLTLTMQLSAVEQEILVTAAAPLIETTRTEGQIRIDQRTIEGLPNNGRDFLNLAQLTPGVTVVQGPDGDMLTLTGQRGINNNVMVDGADFNNPFFGEQRGGQRPAFTFNIDAVQEFVVITDGAPAEFGRSSGGFINVVTKSGTNALKGSFHIFYKSDSLSEDLQKTDGTTEKRDFDQSQIGFTLGGPVSRDKAFFFVSADTQERDETKQTNPDRMPAELIAFLNSAGIPDDNLPIDRTDDADAYMAKIDWLANDKNLLTFRGAYTYSQQENGTFDVDSWGRSINGIETDYSHAFTTSWISTISDTLLNEFRGQYAKEWRPRPYGGPRIPATGNPFPDTRLAFTNEGFGMPFFLPIEYDDDRIQINNNLSILRGNHSIKAGIEYNEVGSSQTFIGFASGRYVFGDLAALMEGTSPFLYLQLVPVKGHTVNSVGTQTLTQEEPAVFIQDQWQPTANLSVEFGLRWEKQDQPEVRTPPSEVFFAPFIGTTVTNEFGTHVFPSDGTIPDDDSLQPRLGVAWSPNQNGVFRANAGYYMARLPALMLASTRSTNGSIGGNVRPDQIPFLPTPIWPGTISPAFTSGLTFLFRPEIFVFHKDFELPKTTSTAVSYEHEIKSNWALLGKVNYAKTDHLTRMFNPNTPHFGCPFETGLGSDVDNPGLDNGIACALPSGSEGLHVVQSNAHSTFWGFTVGLNKRWSNNYQFQIYYTNSLDRSDDDNERDPFTYRYARADALGQEFTVSDRHQRHRINAWLSYNGPWGINLDTRYSYRSAQPLEVNPAGDPVGFHEDRIIIVPGVPSGQFFSGQCFFEPIPAACSTGPVIPRNQGRKNNKLSVLDLRLSKDFRIGNMTLQPILDIFNVFDEPNFLQPEVTSLDFNFDGTLRTGAGDGREFQVGVRIVK